MIRETPYATTLELAHLGRILIGAVRHFQLHSTLLPLSGHSRHSLGEPVTLRHRPVLVGNRRLPRVCPAGSLSRKNQRRDSRCCESAADRVLLFWDLLCRPEYSRWQGRCSSGTTGTRLHPHRRRWKAGQPRATPQTKPGSAVDLLSRLLVTVL